MDKDEAMKELRIRVEAAQALSMAGLPEQAMPTIPHSVIDSLVPALGAEFDSLRALRAAAGGRISREYPAYLLYPLLREVSDAA